MLSAEQSEAHNARRRAARRADLAARLMGLLADGEVWSLSMLLKYGRTNGEAGRSVVEELVEGGSVVVVQASDRASEFHVQQQG